MVAIGRGCAHTLFLSSGSFISLSVALRRFDPGNTGPLLIASSAVAFVAGVTILAVHRRHKAAGTLLRLLRDF